MLKSTSESRSANILLIDDDVELTSMLTDYLRGEGFAVDVLHEGKGAVTSAISNRYDAVILDVMLPDQSGVDLLGLIREKSDVPVIMLTAKGDNLDRVLGLELGADDYISKPYFPRELVARLRAVLRRHTGAPVNKRTEFRIVDLHVDTATRRVSCAGKAVELTASEFKLLATLLRACGQVVSKEELSQEVLGRPRAPYDRSIDVHVSNLRQKLSAAAIVLEAVRGVGYRISAAP